jgi:hypothetical protein
VAVILALLGAAVFAPHVRSGGFYSDDWATASTYHFVPAPHYLNATRFQRAILGGRPLLALAQPLPHALFGVRKELHIALAVALGILVSLGLYLLLRAFRIPPLHALIIAGLALVFPWSDSTRLWPIASLNQLAVCFYLVGVLIALCGLRLGRWRAAGAHAAALVFYAMALLTYEAVAGPILLSGLLYAARGSWRAAWPRWLSDAVVTIGVLAWSVAATGHVRGTTTFSLFVADLSMSADQALELAGRAVRPFSIPLAAALVAGLIVAATAALRGWPDAPTTRRTLRLWGVIAAIAAVEFGCALVPFVGSGEHSLDPGMGNRVNIVAALPLVTLVYAVVMLATTICVSARRDRPNLQAAVTAAIAAFVGLGYTYQVRGDIINWDRAKALQTRMLHSLSQLPKPPSGTVLYVYGYPAVVSPGISIFSQPWDLSSAVRLIWNDSQLAAYPIVAGTTFVCTQTGLYPSAPPGPWGTLQGGYTRTVGAQYAKALFVDARLQRAHTVTNAAACRQHSALIHPAPVVGDAISPVRTSGFAPSRRY